MGPRLHARAAIGGALLLTVGGCNAVLDNHPGILDESSTVGTEPASDIGARDGGRPPPEGSATATAESGHDASTDVSPSPPDAGPPAPVCGPGWADCNGSRADGCESDLTSNIASCGACGVVCPLAESPHTLPVCVNGVCDRACAQGFADCNRKPADGCEANLLKDKRNCGECGTFCLFGKCVDGLCRF